jgi:hypothetical protein
MNKRELKELEQLLDLHDKQIRENFVRNTDMGMGAERVADIPVIEQPFGTTPRRPARQGARPARGHEQVPRYKDPELANTEKFAKGHYGNTDPAQALEKWIVHALKHSEENDKAQNAQISKLSAQVKQLASKQGVTEGLLDRTKRQQIIHYLVKKHGWEANYLELATDHELIKWYKQTRDGHKPMEENYPVCENCGGRHEQELDERGKTSRAVCLSSRSDTDIGASALASCKSQGLRARDGKKSHKLGKTSKSRVKMDGHKIKGAKYGGPLPDWSESVEFMSDVGKALMESYDPQVLAMQKELKAKGADLGPFGPNQDGLDGRLGPYTRRAAQANPDIAKKYQEVLSKPDSVNVSAIDTTVIQDPDFQQKLQKVASALGTTPEALLAVIKHESGGKPYAVNPYSGATGLIQFMPATAQRLGTNVQDLKQMDAVQQLDFVYKYYKMTGVGDGSVGDLYVATFMPKYLGYPPNTVLGQRGAGGFAGQVYDQNKVLDRNQDGQITIADIKSSVQRFA